jgi:hypothetical protein
MEPSIRQVVLVLEKSEPGRRTQMADTTTEGKLTTEYTKNTEQE